MLSVYQLIIPTPYKVGPVNTYLIKNRPVTLVDAGADTPEAHKKLTGMLPLLGVEVDEIERIVLTHSHHDHSGLAAGIASRSGAEVLAHHLEMARLTGEDDYIQARIPFVMETGIPAEWLRDMLGERDKLPKTDLRGVRVREVQGGETLDFDGGELHLLHLPGHSPGHLCLYNPGQKLFFSGDFMLPHITPNPLMEPDPRRPGRRLPALKQYLRGLEQVEQMDIAVVFPGHGGCFTDHLGVINTVRYHHRKQVCKILDRMQGRELNTFQLSREIYPTLKGWDIFLGLSEIQAHLDLLADQQVVYPDRRDGVVYYSSVD